MFYYQDTSLHQSAAEICIAILLPFSEQQPYRDAGNETGTETERDTEKETKTVTETETET